VLANEIRVIRDALGQREFVPAAFAIGAEVGIEFCVTWSATIRHLVKPVNK
jgi:hypothetical protein